MCLYFSRHGLQINDVFTGEITKLMGNKDTKVQCQIASLILKSNLKREALLLAVGSFVAF